MLVGQEVVWIAVVKDFGVVFDSCCAYTFFIQVLGAVLYFDLTLQERGVQQSSLRLKEARTATKRLYPSLSALFLVVVVVLEICLFQL